MQAPQPMLYDHQCARYARSCKTEDLVQDSIGFQVQDSVRSVKILFLQFTKPQHTWPSFVLLNQLDLFSVALASLHLEDGPANH